jgi:hypothetical protein
MAKPTGIRNASSILSNMKYDPLRQQELRQFDAMEGADNRAVSQRNKFLGKQVAQEQTKLMKLDNLGDELAMRKDKLEFAKKIQSRREELVNQKMDISEDSFQYKQMFDYAEGIISAISSPISYMNRRKSKQLQAKEMKEREEHRKFVESRIGKS